MATLRQDHRAALRLRAPVAADIAVREMPVDQVLTPVDRDDRAETIRHDDLAKRDEEGRVSQHVGDLQEAPVRLGRGRDLKALAGRGRDRLFEQHVVAGREETKGARAMVALERRVDQRRRERRPAGDIFPGTELLFGRYAVRVREPRATRIVGLDNRDEFGLVGIALRERAVGEMAPIARPDHYEFDWPHSPKASGCGSFDLRDGLAILRKREDVPDVLGPVTEHEDKLAFADGSEVPNARAVQTVLVHPLELRFQVLLGHAKARIRPCHEESGVGRAESARVLVHPRRRGAAAPMPKIRHLAAHEGHLVAVGEQVTHRILERTGAARTREQDEPEDA